MTCQESAEIVMEPIIKHGMYGGQLNNRHDNTTVPKQTGSESGHGQVQHNSPENWK